MESSLFLFLLFTTSYCNVHRHRNHKQIHVRSHHNGQESLTLTDFDANIQMINPEVLSEEPSFSLLLSEINIDNPGENSKIFLELEAIPKPQVPTTPTNVIAGFFLIVVRGDPLAIVVSVDIGNLIKRQTKQFILIGTKNIEGVDISMESSDFVTIFTQNNGLPNFDDSPCAIMVLYSRIESVRNDLTLEEVDGIPQSIDLTQDFRLRNLIRDNLIDMVVVGRKAPSNYCNFFESLKPSSLTHTNLKVLLRDWDGTESRSSKDISLNRCCQDKRPNDQDCWRHSTTTPGSANLCDNTRRFSLEETIHNMSQDEEFNSNENSRAECRADYPGVSYSQYGLVNDHSYSLAINSALSSRRNCPEFPTELTSTESAPAEQFIEQPVDEQRSPLMKPVFLFDEKKFDKCKKYLTKVNEVNVPAVTSWLEMIRFPRKCLFRCFMCSMYLQHGFRPDVKHPTQIASSGYFSPNYSRNKAHILDHINPANTHSYLLHKEAEKYVSALLTATTPEDVTNAEKMAHESQKEVYKPTLNAMKLAWAELRAEISFRSHSIFYTTVKDLGVNLGTSHSHHHALRFYAKAFSDGFHNRLLKHLSAEQQPFSFIVDATTNKNVGYLVCLIQTLENGLPMLYYWRMIRLTKSESGADMMADIREAVNQDDAANPGFKSYFKSKMITFISDRGSPMVGRIKGLIAKLSEYIGHNLESVACSAHKMETAIKHALDIPTNEPAASEQVEKYYSKFGDFNNKFYTYYMSRGSKRWGNLLEVAEQFGVKATRVKYHHTIRWSKSKKMAMEALLKNFDMLRQDLERSSVEAGDGKEKAKKLLMIISDKSFGSTLAEFVDLLGVSEAMLNAFQYQHGLLLSISDTIREGIRKYEGLKLAIGKNLREFLARMSCPGVCKETECTLEQYDNCAEVNYKSTQDKLTADSAAGTSDESLDEPYDTDRVYSLENKDDKSVSLSVWRVRIYDRIIAEIKTLFDVRLLEAFEIFNPKKLRFYCPQLLHVRKCSVIDECFKSFAPIHAGSTVETVNQKFNRLCTFYSIPVAECSKALVDFSVVLSFIVTQTKYEDRQEGSSAPSFWSVALQDQELPWTNELKNILSYVLVTGQSSASAERAFSSLTRLKSAERSSLGPETLDQLIRIRFNNPGEIDEDSFYEYTLQFLKVHQRVDQRSGENDSDRYMSRSDDSPRGLFFSRSRLFSHSQK